MKRFTIIGGGASGTLLAINLLRAPLGGVEINLVERRPQLGRGVAYSTDNDLHLLNVPAGKMSAFPDEPGHFLEWLRAGGHEYAATDFVPRRIFGEYLLSLLVVTRSEADEKARLNFVDDTAVGIDLTEAGVELALAGGGRLVSDRAVLAFGNAAPPHPSVPDLLFTGSPKYIRNVWSADSFEAVAPDDEVLIIGTGLSMVDAVIHLRSRGHQGPIRAISTRGLLPAPHRLGFTYEDFSGELADKTRITDLHKTVRRHIRRSAANGSDWRAVIDALRPVTQQLWLTLPTAEKRYFMQHLSRYWNAARHRMPPGAAAAIDRMVDEGSLEILKGRLKNIALDSAGRFVVDYDTLGEPHRVETDAILNCIASEANYAKIDNPLIKDLFAKGLARPDKLSLGLDALPNGAIIGDTGERSNVLYTIGTALKGVLWESTAIPEIRVQAQRLASELLSDREPDDGLIL